MSVFSYHWALLVGPKMEDSISLGKRFHAKQDFDGWRYDEQEIPMGQTNLILVRVLAAKVENMDRLLSVIRNVPVRPDVEGWTCKSWVEEAYKALKNDGKALGPCPDWEAFRDTALWYVERKKEEHRFDAQAPPERFNYQVVATWSMIDARELTL